MTRGDKNKQETTSEAIKGGFTDAYFVDARLLRCPLPLLKAKQALNKVYAGEAVRILATDAGSVRDFHSFAKLSGHHLAFFADNGNEFEYVLVKKAEAVT